MGRWLVDENGTHAPMYSAASHTYGESPCVATTHSDIFEGWSRLGGCLFGYSWHPFPLFNPQHLMSLAVKTAPQSHQPHPKSPFLLSSSITNKQPSRLPILTTQPAKPRHPPAGSRPQPNSIPRTNSYTSGWHTPAHTRLASRLPLKQRKRVNNLPLGQGSEP
jgi:hypothetical protein